MGLNYQPAFRIIADGADVTETIRDRFMSLRLTDEVGATADTLELVLADHDPTRPILLPRTGAELQVFLGYGDQAQHKGLFVADEVELSGFPGEVAIRARAAPYESTKAGMADLQTQKTRSWPKGTTIGDMVRIIAGEHRLKAATSQTLAGIVLTHIDQSNESDMNLLRRMARRYDAIAKPAGGALVFTPRGVAQSVSGTRLARVTCTPADGGNYRVVIASRNSAGSCIAYYRSNRKAKRYAITVGSGDPVRRLRMSYPDAASAEAAARAEQRKRARGERGLLYSCPGRPELSAETLVTMQGFRDGVDGDWLVTRVEHHVSAQGYACDIEAELPNSNQIVADAVQVMAHTDVQGATEVA